MGPQSRGSRDRAWSVLCNSEGPSSLFFFLFFHIVHFSLGSVLIFILVRLDTAFAKGTIASITERSFLTSTYAKIERVFVVRLVLPPRRHRNERAFTLTSGEKGCETQERTVKSEDEYFFVARVCSIVFFFCFLPTNDRIFVRACWVPDILEEVRSPDMYW